MCSKYIYFLGFYGLCNTEDDSNVIKGLSEVK